jgi:hypothetical protein
MTDEDYESLKVGDLLDLKATDRLMVITKQPCEHWVTMRRLLPSPAVNVTVPRWIFVTYWLRNTSLIGGEAI